MKLHLGCGQRYIDGYVNIDFPLNNHSVQKKSVADKHMDLLLLSYKKNEIDEIRLHHVFEHFMRPTACALIASWHSWLKTGGIVRIEVPDLQKSGSIITSFFTSKKAKMKSIRHIFGSHEADWAIHCEGYTPKTLVKLLEMFSFKVHRIVKSKWAGTYNFEVIAEKLDYNYSIEEYKVIAEKYLESYLVDYGNSELDLLKIWMQMFSVQLDKTVGK